jgi:hypothetical protein
LSLVPIADGTLLAQVKLDKGRVIFLRLEIERHGSAFLAGLLLTALTAPP